MDTARSNTDGYGTPQKGCVSDAVTKKISCNWNSMATPTCPKAGKNVAVPDNCRPSKAKIYILL